MLQEFKEYMYDKGYTQYEDTNVIDSDIYCLTIDWLSAGDYTLDGKLLLQEYKEQKTENPEWSTDIAFMNSIYRCYGDLLDERREEILDDLARDITLKLEAAGKEVDGEELYDLLYENVLIDYNVNEFLRESKIEVPEVFITIGGFWDDSYKLETCWTDLVKGYNGELDVILKTTDPESDLMVKSPLVGILSKLGYSVNDILTKKDDFASKVFEEIFDYKTILDGMQVTFVPHLQNLEPLLDVVDETKSSIVLKKGTRFGLFNTIDGSGCGLDLELPEDLSLTLGNNDTLVHIRGFKEYPNMAGYYPSEVYGEPCSKPNVSKDQIEIKKGD